MTRILAVDDEPINLMIIEDTLAAAGYQIDQAEDGEVAWGRLKTQAYDLIVLDRIMPRLDGLSLLRQIKADPRWSTLPVIMVTAAGTQQQILEGMEAGAYYYLTKPYEPKLLRTMVDTVVAELAEKVRLKEVSGQLLDTLALFEQGEVRFRTLTEARNLAAAMAGLCSGDTLMDTGLLELLVNAVEHGNLGITYQEKSQLRLSGQWDAEVERRLAREPWSSRYARLSFRRDGDSIQFTVTDQGGGFDWRPYLEFDPLRAFDPNGRGIAMARMMSFTSLEYQGSGNTVVARATAQRHRD